MRIAVLDDDLLTLRGAAAILEASPRFSHSVAMSLDQALKKPSSFWHNFDRILVDVHDKAKEMQELGTDVYTGITVIEAIRRGGFSKPIVAVTPSKANPLLAQRLLFSGAHFVYERWDFRTVDDVINAVADPCDLARPRAHPAPILLEEGLVNRANPNRAVEVYKASPLYGKVRPDITQAATGPRRAAIRLRDEVVSTGFVGTGANPRWNEVRDYLLKLTGRMPVTSRRPPV